MPLIPRFKDHADYSKHFLDQDLWNAVLAAVLPGLDRDPSQFERCHTGSAIVYRSETEVFKLFDPLWPTEFPRERGGMQHFQNLEIPVPQLLETGRFEQSDYLLMSRLPGQSVGEVWPQMSPTQQTDFVGSIGQLIQQLHSQPASADAAFALDWNDFVQQRCQVFAKQQRQNGLSDEWTDKLEHWLLEHIECLPARPSKLLHCDLTADHFLVSPRPGSAANAADHWQLTGLIDFGDAMNGHPYYEFGAPLVYLTQGQSKLRRQFLLAYGFEQSELNADLSQQLFCALLLHRFLHIPYYFKTYFESEPASIAALSDYFCGLED